MGFSFINHPFWGTHNLGTPQKTEPLYESIEGLNSSPGGFRYRDVAQSWLRKTSYSSILDVSDPGRFKQELFWKSHGKKNHRKKG